MPTEWVEDPLALTPCERRGQVWLKRDDLFCFAGCRGGKVRTCWSLALGAKGLVAASHRHSPQMEMVARVAQAFGIPCQVHTSQGAHTPQMANARLAGAEIQQHTPGYNGLIICRAKASAAALGWQEIPFGMESAEAVAWTAIQAANVPAGARRLVIAVGIGMSLCGVLAGLPHPIPVLAVAVGCPRPEKYIDRWAPAGWRQQVSLIHAAEGYSAHVEAAVDGVQLDPVYEAKAARFLRPGDLFWIVGRRGVIEGLRQLARPRKAGGPAAGERLRG